MSGGKIANWLTEPVQRVLCLMNHLTILVWFTDCELSDAINRLDTIDGNEELLPLFGKGVARTRLTGGLYVYRLQAPWGSTR